MDNKKDESDREAKIDLNVLAVNSRADLRNVVGRLRATILKSRGLWVLYSHPCHSRTQGSNFLIHRSLHFA